MLLHNNHYGIRQGNFGSLQVVLKSQILAGGRGLGTFKSGLQGGVHMCKTGEIKALAEKMLGQTLVTKQTGPTGTTTSHMDSIPCRVNVSVVDAWLSDEWHTQRYRLKPAQGSIVLVSFAYSLTCAGFDKARTMVPCEGYVCREASQHIVRSQENEACP